MYLGGKIKDLLSQARVLGCAITIRDVEFINATSEELVFDDGTICSGSLAIAEKFERIAERKLIELFRNPDKDFWNIAIEGTMFDAESQSFSEYKAKKKPLIIVNNKKIAQILRKPTVLAITYDGKTIDKKSWILYGWELGNPYRLR